MTVIIIVLITHCFIRHGVSYVKNSAARDLCPTLKVYFHKNLAMHRHNYNCFPELGYIKFTTIVVTGAWQTKHSSLMVRARSFIRWIFLQHWLVRCLKWNQPLSRTHTSLGLVLNIALLLCQNQIVWFRQKCGIVKYRVRSIISFPVSIPVCPGAICFRTALTHITRLGSVVAERLLEPNSNSGVSDQQNVGSNPQPWHFASLSKIIKPWLHPSDGT